MVGNSTTTVETSKNAVVRAHQILSRETSFISKPVTAEEKDDATAAAATVAVAATPALPIVTTPQVTVAPQITVPMITTTATVTPTVTITSKFVPKLI